MANIIEKVQKPTLVNDNEKDFIARLKRGEEQVKKVK